MIRTLRLGSTGLLVTPIGLGLAALGRPAYINADRARDLGPDRSVAAMEQRCHDVLDGAHAAGIRYVDAARSYGFAEQFLASWLERRRLAPDALTIGSKWGYTYTGGWRLDAPVHEVKDLTLDTLRRQLDESRGILGNHLHLFQIHSATLESGVLDDTAVLRELVRLRAGGLAIGLTVSGPKQADVVRRALRVLVDGANPFQVVQATWNLMETSVGPALAEAKALGCGVIVKEVLANGRLTDGHDTRSDPEVEPLRLAAAERHTTLDVLAIAAALSQPWADVVLSGAVTPAQFDRSLRALPLTLKADDLPRVALAPAEYWTRRGMMRWA
jgi:aryl-alcohol dehydrogenase-like predicted oxidoreductase